MKGILPSAPILRPFRPATVPVHGSTSSMRPVNQPLTVMLSGTTRSPRSARIT